MKCHNKAVATLIFPDHRLGAATEDGKLSVWDNCSGARLSSFNNDRWGPIAVSQDLTMHAWTSDKDDSIELRSLKDGTRLHEFYGHTQDVTPIAFSHKPTWLISASYDATIKIWDIADGRCLQTFSGQGRGEVSPLFDLSHDSKRLASIVGGSTVMIWDTNSGSVNLTNSLGLGMEIEAMAFSRDSLFLATGSYAGIVKIWDCQSGVSLQTLEGCGDAVSADLIAFSDDGQRLAMCDSEATAQIWDVGDNSNASNYQDLEVAYREFHWTALLLDSTQLIICYHEAQSNSGTSAATCARRHSGLETVTHIVWPCHKNQTSLHAYLLHACLRHGLKRTLVLLLHGICAEMYVYKQVPPKEMSGTCFTIPWVHNYRPNTVPLARHQNPCSWISAMTEIGSHILERTFFRSR
jgi:WD40 repeat protein